jgi:hypothetical protein
VEARVASRQRVASIGVVLGQVVPPPPAPRAAPVVAQVAGRSRCRR